jgi:hypothetical protein
VTGELEDRLREALAGRADEVGHPPADELALARRRAERARDRSRRRVAVAGVAASLLLAAGVWRATDRPHDGDEVRTGPTPALGALGACGLDAGAPGAPVAPDLPGFALVEADHAEAGARPEGWPTSLTLYLDGAAEVGLAVTVGRRIEVSTAGEPAELATGRSVQVREDDDVTTATWALPDGTGVRVEGLGLNVPAVVAAAGAADLELAGDPSTPVTLDGLAEGLDLVVAAATPAARPAWTATATDGDDHQVRVRSTPAGDMALARAVVDGWDGGGLRWEAVAGQPALVVPDGDGFVLHLRRDDGWYVRVDADLAVARAPEVAAGLCSVPRQAWDDVERLAAAAQPPG